MTGTHFNQNGIILDHGTVCGALRAICKLPIQNFDEFEVDIACLKLLVESIISFDNLYLFDINTYEENTFQATRDILDSLSMPITIVHFNPSEDDIDNIALDYFNSWGEKAETVPVLLDLLHVRRSIGEPIVLGSEYSGKYFSWANAGLNSKIPLNYVRKLQAMSNLEVDRSELTRYFESASYRKIVLGIMWLGYRTSLYNLS